MYNERRRMIIDRIQNLENTVAQLNQRLWNLEAAAAAADSAIQEHHKAVVAKDYPKAEHPVLHPVGRPCAMAFDVQDEPSWPMGPFSARCDNVTDPISGWSVRNADGFITCKQCSQSEAEAIALALDWTPRAAAAIRRVRGMLEYTSDRGAIDFLLAALEGWDMPGESNQ